MANISVKLNLAGLKHTVKKMKGQSADEIECLVIPIDLNKLYRGEKGLYLDLTLIEIKDRSKQAPDQKDTHLVKQSLPKDFYETLSEEEKKAYPILGNAILWSGSSEPALAEPQEEESDLPF